MPYIPEERRKVLSDVARKPLNAGELNYLITELCDNYLMMLGKSYQKINDVVGALEGAKMEFYARIARPYEDTKIRDNGDVYKSL